MPTAKALKRDASSSNPWWRTLAKWRNLTRRTSSDQELTSNGWDSPLEVRWPRKAEREYDDKSRSTRA
jgi:hypothetical protein